jgi:hypothetical protein
MINHHLNFGEQAIFLFLLLFLSLSCMVILYLIFCPTLLASLAYRWCISVSHSLRLLCDMVLWQYQDESCLGCDTIYKIDIKFQRTLTLKMDAAGSSEILIISYQNAWNQITEDYS